MKRALLVFLAATACSSPPRKASSSFVPARVAMDSAQIERLCVKPGHVRAGLLDCELKDQSAQIAVPILDRLR